MGYTMPSVLAGDFIILSNTPPFSYVLVGFSGSSSVESPPLLLYRAPVVVMVSYWMFIQRSKRWSTRTVASSSFDHSMSVETQRGRGEGGDSIGSVRPKWNGDRIQKRVNRNKHRAYHKTTQDNESVQQTDVGYACSLTLHVYLLIPCVSSYFRIQMNLSSSPITRPTSLPPSSPQAAFGLHPVMLRVMLRFGATHKWR